MPDLSTKYMTIPLKNPLIAGASNLSLNPERLRQMEASGAAAVVFKSLFEEQIQLESWQMEQELGQYSERNAEMTALFPRIEHAGASAHLLRLRQARQALTIPLIASLNAVSESAWVDYSIQLAETGVDGLELNFYQSPRDFELSAQQIEDELLSTLAHVRERVSIPLSVKLSPYYTNTLHLIREIDRLGIQGFVLFNRLFQPDIDISQESHTFPWNLSREGDARLSLRYTGLLQGRVQGSLIAGGGILSGHDAIQLILAGADAVQVVSTLYYNQIPYLSHMLEDIQAWMQEKGYASLSDFRGKLSRDNSRDPLAYQRGQYVDILFQRSEDLLPQNALP